MEKQIKKLGWRWDRTTCVLWGNVTFTDGSTSSVGIPLATVVAHFDAAASALGIHSAPFVGDVDSVDGFFSGIKRLAKKVGRVAKKAVRTTQKTLAKTVHVASGVVRSKLLKTAVSGLAVAFPAVGGPALAALTAANAAANVYDKADKAITTVRSVARGRSPIPAATAAIRRVTDMQANVRRLTQSRSPMAGMAVAALKSVQV